MNPAGDASEQLARLRAELDLKNAYQNYLADFLAAHADRDKLRLRGGDRERLARLRQAPDYTLAYDEAEPLISVIIPTYNRGQLILDRTLPSVLNQTYGNWEVIIVGDAMDDENAELLAGIDHPRVYFHNLKFRGRYPQRSAARWCVAGIKPINTGLRLARGRWIAHLDDDDEFTPAHLESLLKLARRERVEWAHAKVMFVAEDGRRQIVGEPKPAHGGISRISSLYHAGLKTFRYNPRCWHYGYPGDWDLWERFLEMAVSHAHLGQVTAVHHGAVDEWRKVYGAPSQPRPQHLQQPAAEGGKPGLRLVNVERGDGPSRPQPMADYALWVRRHAPDPREGQRWADSHRADLPAFHLVMPLKAPQQGLLADTIDALAAQWCGTWRLTVVADGPCPDPLFDEADMLAWVQSDDPAALLPPGNDDEWLLWVAPGTQLSPQALAAACDHIAQHPDWRFVYMDEDCIREDGSRFEPQFKPDFNLELLRAMPYMGRACLVRRDALNRVGLEPALPLRLLAYDLALRVCDGLGPAAIGHIPRMLWHHPADLRGIEPVEDEIGALAVQAHLERRGIPAPVSPGLAPHSHFVDYPLSRRPLVSVIIPTKDRLDLIQPCVDSLLNKTAYEHFEVLIMDNGSTEGNVLAYLEALPRRDERVRVLPWPHPYNFSAINNAAAAQARGEFLLLLNNDTLIVQENWLERMLALGLSQDVGIVGARLVFANQRLQHAGVVLGINGSAEHPHIDLPLDQPGYMGRAQVAQDFSAVTGACLLIPKAVYDEVGGLDEKRYEVLFNDVDLCLKVGRLGRRVVWTPHATVVHLANSSLKTETDPKKVQRYLKAKDHLLEDWRPLLARDPAYNPNLSLQRRDFGVEVVADVPWDIAVHDRPRIMAWPFNAWATGEYRVKAPLRALGNQGLARCLLMPDHDRQPPRMLEPVEMERARPDAILIQNATHERHLQAMEQYKRHNPEVFRVYGQDDLVFQVPQKNPFRKSLPKDNKTRVRRAVALCDRLIVATEPMREAMAGMIDDIRVMPNYLENALWEGLTSQRRRGPKPRVGWAGGEQHQGDLEVVLPLLQATAEEVDWIFFGMCPKALQPYIKEFHQGVYFNEYPAKLATLDLDLAIAPLEHNRFNAAKSNLRLLEYGILGWPVICTDIQCYRDYDPPVTRVPNNPRAWINAVRERIRDLDATAAEGDRLREWVRGGWMLEDHGEDWLKALLPD